METDSKVTIIQRSNCFSTITADDGLVQKDIVFLSLPQPTSIEIKAASLDKLLEFLTHESYTDPKYRNAFLLTYRSFCTASELLAKLIDRFRASDLDPEGSTRRKLFFIWPSHSAIYLLLRKLFYES